MRFLQTSDWHLGHTLHDVPREHEHARFLAWLLDTLVDERCDAMLMCGDVFETANPPATALAAWYDFLAAAHRRLPALQIVVIGGNHDSPARLEAARALLTPMSVTVVGSLPRRPGGELDLERLVVPLRDAGGAIAAWVAAVPFLRPGDLPAPAARAMPAAPRSVRDSDDDVGAAGDPLIEGVRAVYAEVLAAARARRRPGQALIGMGHAFLVGGALSLLSERRILGGNQHALPIDIFPDDVGYVALGHLHKAQRVAGREHVRYAGSPVPLAMAELDYRHTVCVVDIDGEAAPAVRALDVPRTRELRRVPRHGAAPIDEVLAALRGLDDAPPLSAALSGEADAMDGAGDDEVPLLEVCVALERPEPRLRRRVEDALAGKRHRLVKLSFEYRGDGVGLADGAAGARGAALAELAPAEVFERRYRRDHDGAPPEALLAAFHEVLEAVQTQGGS